MFHLKIVQTERSNVESRRMDVVLILLVDSSDLVHSILMTVLKKRHPGREFRAIISRCGVCVDVLNITVHSSIGNGLPFVDAL